jgi:predicted metallo-beta-lactamase superfamily hydrolase
VEATFPGIGTYPITLTSGVVIAPDTYPYPPFEAENPRGTPME